MPVNFGMLSPPQGQGNPGIQTQALPSGGDGGMGSILDGVQGLLGSVFGKANPVSQANAAINQTMSQTPLQALAGSLLPQGTQQSGPQQHGILGQAMGLGGGKTNVSLSDNPGYTDFKGYQQQTQQGQGMPKATPASLGGMAPASTMPLIQGFEGYASKPYWDVNAYRAGYGSDTVTYSDGSVHPIKQGMSVNRDDAERDLERRTQQFAGHASSQVGASQWKALPDPAKAALTSVTYNYGSLPSNVVKAVQTGDINSIANSVEDLKHHNKGINSDRRQKEADMIRSSGGMI